jgi:exopolyphosphatase / guanosine-5'-triphosphate,3'-diphosphate pyrophosphatase
MRVATIDIGTNTVLLLVAERVAGATRVVLERAEITRLGEGVDRTRHLAPAAVSRTLDCLARYAGEVRSLGVDQVAVVGTSAMRDAPGGAPLTTFVREALGVEARVLTGEDEARLTFRGALRGIAADPAATAAVFDIGGGSTEVIVGRLRAGQLDADYLESFDVGSVRLTERHLAHDPPGLGELHLLRVALAETFAPLADLPAGLVPVGVAGTMTTLAAVAMGLEVYDGARVHGHAMSTEELRAVVARLSQCDLEARRLLTGMEPKRADVIVAGGLIALALLDRWGASGLIVSDGGVRWGLADELLSPNVS